MKQKPTFQQLRRLRVCAAICLAMVLTGKLGYAQTGTLSESFPAPAPNAALHYQRALLYLAKLDGQQTQLLCKPIWEVVPAPSDQECPREIARLLHQARFAVRSAATGSRTDVCNFGIDFRQHGAATHLPHVEGMVQLGRLLTLRAAQAESQGEWEVAAIIYFDGLRMGRHLTHQSTLLEALAGMEILRNNYFALARWGARCPSRKLVARSFGLLESMQRNLVEPSQVLARESSIMSVELDRLRDAYPDGCWSEMILESLGQEVAGERQANDERAIAACVKLGVPQNAFSSSTEFGAYIDKIQATGSRFAESVIACMALPPQTRVQRAQVLREKYGELIKVLAAETLIDPVEVGILLSEHEAELTLARLALAVSASKKDGKLPDSLQAVAVRFGGTMPANPYTGEAVGYRVSEDGSGFALRIPSQDVFAEADFKSLPPAPVQ